MGLSPAALALFRLHLERHGDLDAEANRAGYQELERAGLVAVGHSFRDGRNSIYRLTKEGFERKGELLACAKEAG
jgi:DNA-binding transcriptional ArsR family regulator